MSASAANCVERIFDEMFYGPAPEDPKNAFAWFDEHKRKFGHFINGKWYQPEGREYLISKNPANGEKLAETIQGTEEDVDYAVGCARKAFQNWSSLPNHVRARHMYSFARHVQKHQRLLSVIESLDNGKPIRETRDADVPLIVRHLYHYAGWAQLRDTEMKNWRPIGVIGAIVPWNFPLMLMTWKIAPALAMGNTVVLKPASYTRLSALLLAEIAKEAGLPDGVFNIVTGNGRFGSKLAAHDDVDKVAFTGSTEIGQHLRRLTAGTGKKISLELGGKSPVVVFDSADLDSAVEGIVDAIWFNQGQVCSAGSRIFVQETVYENFVKRIKERLSHWRVGDSLDKAVDMGALVDESQLTTIKKYVQTAIDEGGEVFQPKIKLPENGFFYPPTLITNVQTSSTVFLEEIFGPVAVLLPFRTAKEAVTLANNTKFGLAASVWTEKTTLNLEVALLIKAGAVWINCHNMFDAAAGFGGYRQSGYGRDGGKEGLYEYAKPSWETRHRPMVTEDLTEFGKSLPGLPKLPSACEETQQIPKIDRTYKLFYNGSQKRPDGQYSRPVYGVKGQMIAQVSDSNRKDVREAVEAAKKALPGWSKRAAHNRAQIIYYLAENLELRRDEFSEMLQQLTGVSQNDALLQIDKSIERLFYWSAYADKYGGTVQETLLYGATVKIHEPIGLIAISCPDEEPLLSFISLLAPAVVRGNVVVMATSDKFPLPAIDLVQVLETSDVPAGVINVLTGNKDHITKYLAEHQNVEAMWYFGEALGSKFVEYASAENLKRTWVNYGKERNWSNDEQGAGEEFLYHTTQVKNIWMPMGDIFAN